MGMAMYCHRPLSETVQKYIIQFREGAFAWNETEKEKELRRFYKIKWNTDFSFACSLSAFNLYLIRYVDDKEQVVFKVKRRWTGMCALVWTDTSILVFESNWLSGNKLHILKF